MIEQQTVEFDGREYTWTYDPAVEPPEKCWVWMETQTCEQPAKIIWEKLNELFVRDRAPQMIEDLDDKEYPRFRRILKSMNATTDLVRKLMGEPDTGRGLPLDVKFHKESPLHAGWQERAARFQTS